MVLGKNIRFKSIFPDSRNSAEPDKNVKSGLKSVNPDVNLPM